MLLKEYYFQVEKALSDLGLDVQACRGKNSGEWEFNFGNANILIDVYQKDEQVYFQALALIYELELNNFELFNELLEYNHSFIDIFFTKYKNLIFLKTSSLFNDLTGRSLVNRLKRLAIFADNMKEIINKKYTFNNEKQKILSLVKEMIKAIETKNYFALSSLCNKDIGLSPLLQKLCNMANLSERDRRIMEVFFRDISFEKDVSLFTHEGKRYAHITLYLNKVKYDLFLVEYQKKWFLFNLVENKS